MRVKRSEILEEPKAETATVFTLKELKRLLRKQPGRTVNAISLLYEGLSERVFVR